MNDMSSHGIGRVILRGLSVVLNVSLLLAAKSLQAETVEAKTAGGSGSGTAAVAQEPVTRLPDWFAEPVQRNRHTRFLVRFDTPGRCDADYARGMALANGRGYEAAAGRYGGGGVEIDVSGAQVNYAARGNMRAARGTVRLWVRSKPGTDIWKDGKEHWFFSAAAVPMNLELWKDGGNRLRLTWAPRPWPGDGEPAGELSVPVQELAGEAWHHLAFSWDSAEGRLWLAVDGDVTTGRLEEPLGIEYFHIFFLGASYYGGVGPRGLDPETMFKTAGAILDEVEISDITIPELVRLRGRETDLPEELVLRVQDAVRRHLDFIETLQRNGAWPSMQHSWPQLLPGETSYRGFFYPELERYVEFTHNQSGTAGAARMFLHAYQAMGDDTFLATALEAGEWVLAAQQPEGYWSERYDRHIAGPPTPLTGVRQAHRRVVHREDPTFGDHRQIEGTLLMAELYLETGEQKWLDALRRSADFHLLAQNPNGSWGHHYNLRERQGENRNLDPGGSELDNGNQIYPILALLVAHRITGEAKYLEGLRRGGDWHIASQLGPPTYGWSLAYDGDNVPVWARVYHPPALSSGSSSTVCRSLCFMYDLTGDPKYLEPVRNYIEWEKTALRDVEVDGEQVAMRSRLVDYKTGRPIAVDLKTWTIHFLDTPENRAAFLETGTQSWISKEEWTKERPFPWHLYAKRPDYPALEPLLGERSDDGKRPRPARLSEEELRESVATLSERAEQIMAAQNEAGLWVLPVEGQRSRATSIGSYFVLVDGKIYSLLWLLERARILSGEIDSEIWTYPLYLIPEPLRHENWMASSEP